MRPATPLAFLTTALVLLVWACSDGNGGTTNAVNPTSSSSGSSGSVGPEPPTNLAVSEGNEQLTISWNEVDDAETYELRYKEAEPEDAEYTTLPEEGDDDITATNHTITDLANDTTYEVEVRSVDSNDTAGSWSESVTGTPSSLPAPTDVAAAEEDGQLTITWNAVSTAAKYHLRHKEEDDAEYTLITNDDGADITGQSFVLDELTNGEQHTIQVRIVTSAGREGPWSAPAMGRPFSLSAPTNLASVVGDERLKISWDAVSGAAKYEVRKKEAAQQNSAYIAVSTNLDGTDIASTNVTLDGLTNGTNYQIQVRSVNAFDQHSDWSATSAMGTPVDLATPTNLDAVEGDGQLTISWDGASGATKYFIRHKESTQADAHFTNIEADDNADLTNTNFVLDGLTNGTNYDFQVRSVNALEQTSPWSTNATGTPTEALGPPFLALLNDTGDDNTDNITTDPTLRIDARAGASVTLTLTYNGSPFSGQAPLPIVMPMSGTTNTNLISYFRAIAEPVGDDTDTFVVSGVASLDGETSEASDNEEFTVISLLNQAYVDINSFSFQTNSGNTDDSITTWAFLTVDVEVPAEATGATLTIDVTTNGDVHSHSFAPLTSGTLGTGNNFGLSSTSRLLEVSITARLTRHAHSVRKAPFEYTFIPWWSSIAVSYTDDGEANDDGLTTRSEVSITTFANSGLPHDNIKLVRYVVTNTTSSAKTTNDLTGTGQQSLAANYVLDLRDAKPTLATNEKIHSLKLNYVGHEVSYTFDPGLQYIPFTVTYNDDDVEDDGITTQSEITISGPSLVPHADIKLISYVITNTMSSATTTNDLMGDDQVTLNAQYQIDLREVKDPLGEDEKIHSLKFDYDGTELLHVFDPALRYVEPPPEPFAAFARKFSIAPHDGLIFATITSSGVVLVTSTAEDNITFHDTNGDSTNLTIGGASVSTFGSRGGADGQFNNPHGLAIGADSKIYVPDRGNFRLQVFNANFTHNTNIAVPNTEFFPEHLIIHNGTLYVGGQDTNDFYLIQTYAESGYAPGSNIATSGKDLRGVAVDSDGVHHVANASDDQLEAWTGSRTTGFTKGNHSISLRTDGTTPNTSSPRSVAIDPSTDNLFVSDITREQVLVFSYDSTATTNHYTLLGVIGHPTPGTSGSEDGQFNNPTYMFIHNGELYVIDSDNDRIQVFTLSE